MRTYTFDASGNLTGAGSGASSPPVITAQPVDQVVKPGSWTSFSVLVAGAGGLTFQWAFNGADILGSTGDSLVVNNAGSADVGDYTVTVANALGSATSRLASLKLDDGLAPPSARPQLTAYSDLGGSITVSPMKLGYDPGEAVTLTATPFPPSTFLGWYGLSPDALVTTNPIIVTMSADTAVRARFVSPAAIPEGLVALWRGDATGTDAIGGHTGAFFSGAAPATPTVSASGKTGDAFTFDGTTHITVPDAVDLHPAAMTLEAWVFPTAWTGNTVIARGSATDVTNAWYLGADSQPTFWAHGGTNQLQSPQLIPINRWTHLAATFDGTTKRLFINGVEVAAQGGLGPLAYDPNLTAPVTIGASLVAGVPTANFTGMIDEVALYGRALTSNEIRALADADLAGKDLTSPYVPTDSPLPPASLGADYEQQLKTVLGTPPVTLTLSGGQLPPGVDLSSSGAVWGQPSAAGTFGFTVRATDASQRSSERLYVLKVRAPIAPPSDLVGWWRGEVAAGGASAQDSIGAHHGGFFSGAIASPPSYAPDGMVGGAFALDGSHYIRVDDAPDLRPNELTLEAWVYPTALNEDELGVKTVIARGSATDVSDMWWLGLVGGQPEFWSQHGGLAGPPKRVAVNRWTHLAATFDGATKRLFVGGVQVAEVGDLGPFVYPNQSVPATIGADWTVGHPDGFFTGMIDEVCLYRRALTADEIFAIADAGENGMSDSAPYITSPSQLSAVSGRPYSHTVVSVLGAAPVSYSLPTDGTLDPGLTLSAGGILSGIPAAAGVFDFVIRATDAAGKSGSQRCTLRVFSPVEVPAGVVGWWRAEGVAQDSAGNNHGLLRNGAGFAEGKVGQAFLMDGATGHVEVPDAPELRLAALTIEAWAMLDVTSGARFIAAKPAGGGPSDSYALWLSYGQPMAAVGIPAGLGPLLFAPETLAPGRWHHLAYTVDDGTKTQALYVNGLRVASGNVLNLPGYDGQPLLIGCDKDSGQLRSFLQGRIDEVTIYNRALDYAEILAIYNAGPAGKTTGP